MSREQRITDRAYQLWIDEGMPDGRADAHWDLASELVAIEENPDLMLKPNPLQPGEEIYPDGPGESLEVMDNLGEFPTLTDQGEEQTTPARRRSARSRTTEAPVLSAADAPPSDDAAMAAPRRRTGKAASKPV